MGVERGLKKYLQRKEKIKAYIKKCCRVCQSLAFPFSLLRDFGQISEKQITEIHTVLIMNKFLFNEMYVSHKYDINVITLIDNECRKLT